MRYQKSGEKEQELGTEFDVTKGDDYGKPVVVLELWGGSEDGEYFTMSLEEARVFRGKLDYVIEEQARQARLKFCRQCGVVGNIHAITCPVPTL